MTREEYLKEKINERNTTLKAIASEIGVPYSTLRDMQSNIGSARVDNVIKLCKYLGISVEELNSAKTNAFELSDHERKLIIAYRQYPEFQAAIDSMLNITDTDAKAKKIG